MLLPFQNLPGRFEGEEPASVCLKSSGFFFKFLSANETGATGSHQAGFYIHRDAYWLFMPEPGKKGENQYRDVAIHWPEGTVTDSRFRWYGKGTRSEYRLTQGFHFLGEENTGDLLVLARLEESVFQGFLLSREESIESFLQELGLNPSDSGKAYGIQNGEIQLPGLQYSAEDQFESTLQDALREYLEPDAPFPAADRLARLAREQCEIYFRTGSLNLDEKLLRWIDMEYRIFRWLELRKYSHYLSQGFSTMEDMIQLSLTILNRRKSRAGYGLELHLAALFESAGVTFASQARTEGNKKPDFLFPSQDAYSNPDFPASRLTFLGVKTTCKDRWRQILSEADRIPEKHLFTLQQGISSAQLREMAEADVQLVIPRPYHRLFPESFRKQLMSLEGFVDYVRSKDSQEMLFR
ncbi:MAG: restriction endonuclease [Spirochaetaceae bacterium]|nr:restriction endonuclease [Spirochaetaceae bacterium]|tara:strand:- start:32042 stop:33271 length:1230 start_codon:yes stop_codon:yes gene_type:complete